MTQQAATYPEYAGEPADRDLAEYLGILRRRWPGIALVAAALAAVTLAVALLWPPTYRSSATILIQEQEIPADLVRSTVTSFADERIQVISQQVMTRAVLLALVEKYDLYPDRRRWATSEELLERMRRDIRLGTVNADITDRRSGTRINSTIAFKLSFDSAAPEAAQRVANDLVSLYLNENIKTRQQRAAETSSFLAEEAERLSQHISRIQDKLARFKARNQGRLPELAQLNLQLTERTDAEILRVERELAILEDRRIAIEGQLAQVRPNAPLGTGGEAVLDPADRLKNLEARHAGLSGVYSDDHPDIKRMRREMAALRRETGAAPAPADLTADIAARRAQLAELRERYAEDHPDVLRLARSTAALEASADGASAPPAARAERKPDNPLYITLRTQLESIAAEVRNLRALREDLRARLRGYERRLEQTPGVEREYLELVRDYENSVARYREVKAKQMQAEVAQELEKDRKAERFTLIDPPQLPEQPVSPNRLAILLVGLLASASGGLGFGALREALDGSVKGARDLVRVAPAPVLAAIPYVESDARRAARARRRLLVALALAAALVVALVVVHFFVRELPVLWFSLLRRLTAF
jgi:uncharacterized protein involved in exopolysaccharide biosynthesis